LEIAVGFMTVGLTSIGGAAGPFRHVAVVQRRWLSEREFAELYGLGQALPGSVVMNVTTMLTDRLAGPLGPLAALLGLIVPAMVLAIVLSGIATHFAETNARFAAGEVGVTAAIAGIFASNGVRVLAQLWSDTPDLRLAWRCTRIAIGALGVLLVVGLHLIVPLAMIVIVALSLVLEWRLRNVANA
jgi:chromate transporter